MAFVSPSTYNHTFQEKRREEKRREERRGEERRGEERRGEERRGEERRGEERRGKRREREEKSKYVLASATAVNACILALATELDHDSGLCLYVYVHIPCSLEWFV